MLSSLKNRIKIDPIIHKKGAQIDMLRLDLIHPVVSGNKLFKLSEYLYETLRTDHKTILTFGGAYSNHLHATAYACQSLNIRCIGIVRGKAHEINSQTIDDCKHMGMEIHYADRETFRRLFEQTNTEEIKNLFGDCMVVPSGGLGLMGARGASLITNSIPENVYTHLCLAVGSATTLAGIMMNDRNEKIIAFPALKGMNDLTERLNKMGIQDTDRVSVCADFHFGGFARKTPDLINFMNEFYTQYRIPLDFVYTGKLMFGIFEMLNRQAFPQGSRILAFHTGGLQGNRSLPKNTLSY